MFRCLGCSKKIKGSSGHHDRKTLPSADPRLLPPPVYFPFSIPGETQEWCVFKLDLFFSAVGCLSHGYNAPASVNQDWSLSFFFFFFYFFLCPFSYLLYAPIVPLLSQYIIAIPPNPLVPVFRDCSRRPPIFLTFRFGWIPAFGKPPTMLTLGR